MKTFLSRLGPGLLYAGAAVGVSHLVQSTRAGTNYGMAMIAVVIIANLIKYPFFKAGPLYAATHGKSLLQAFQEKGKGPMALFYLLAVSAMFTVQAAVTLLTASILSSIFKLSFPLWQVCAVLLIICSAILLIGKYKVLSQVMKTVILLLTVTTLITLIAAFIFDQEIDNSVAYFSFENTTDILFLIAFVGWMPAPLDISLWHSEWSLETAKNSRQPLTRRKAIFDFNIGYWGTAILAIAFVLLGSLILRGNGSELPTSGVVFSSQLIDMYVSTLGNWSFVIVALAAFTTMFSTTLTVLDAYPRVLTKAISLEKGSFRLFSYPFFLMVLTFGAISFLAFLGKTSMTQLIDLATTVSFLTAPVLATLIYTIVQTKTSKLFSKAENALALLGLLFLYVFSIYFIYVKWIS